MVAYEGTLRISLRKDGTGLPPQGRTVRAGAALPPGGARLLFCSRFPRPATSVAAVAAVAAFPVFPLSLWRLAMNVHTSCRPSLQFNPDREAAGPASPCPPGREFALVRTGSGTDWDNEGLKKPGSSEQRLACYSLSLS